MLNWSQSYELGIEEIDSDHKNMFGFVAKIERAFENGDIEESTALIDRFIDAAIRHFENEEKLLTIEEYPEITEHSNYHESLLLRTLEMKANCEKNFAAGDAVECFKSMIDVLLDDIVKGDMQIKSYLQARFNL